MNHTPSQSGRRRLPLFLLLPVLAGGCWIPARPAAAQAGPEGENCLPVPVERNHFSALQEHSPFTRTLDASGSLVLTGVARIDGKPVATVLDARTRGSYIITETPNSEGWKLVDYTAGEDLETSTVKVSVAGGELVDIRYNREAIEASLEKPSKQTATKQAPKPDTRPAPTDEEKRRYHEIVKQKWESLNKDQQEWVKKVIGEKMRQNQGLSDRQKGELTMKVLDYAASRGKK